MDLSGSAHDRCGEDVAPYALGALSETDARDFQEHLETCELCRADLATLAPVVRALPETPDQVDPPPELRRRVMAVVEQEAAVRRRASAPEKRERRLPAWLPRPMPALAAACVLLVAGLGVGIVLSGEQTTTVAASDAPAGVRAALHVEEDRGRLEVHGMAAPGQGRVLQVWLMRGRSTTPEPTDALFTPNRSGDASVAVPGDIEDVSRVLVSEEPAGGSPSPTTTPSIDFRLS